MKKHQELNSKNNRSSIALQWEFYSNFPSLKFKDLKVVLITALFLFLVLNVGCGGGSSPVISGPPSSSPPPPPPPVTPTTPPSQPVDISPISGDIYYVLNQGSGLQADLMNNSTTAGDPILQQTRSFTNLSQRWVLDALPDGNWSISNEANGLCFDVSGTALVQNPCSGAASQEWMLTATSNGYYTIASMSSSLVIDVPSVSAGASLDLSALSGSASQSQEWLLRPAFFRGVDNALLEKQEADRAVAGVPWWKDGGHAQDILAILKKHGVNMIRLRPSSSPPYANPSQAGCSGNLCFAETDAQDLDLAKRAKNLGMSVQLTLLFDGGNSLSVPAAWASDSFTQLQTDLYNYVKQEITKYRQAGVMPDLVSIGNEVDTGFLGTANSPTGNAFENFAILEKQGIQAVEDAAADTSSAPAIPAPLTCIHITPAWNLTDFFTLANQNGIQYDAICQSYYPIFHGPLTDAQATASNPNGKPVEQDVLTAAANNIAKPIFIIEAGEHYENGFDANDPWYAPPSTTAQAQFLTGLKVVAKGLPNHLGMGVEYWDATGADIPRAGGGSFNGGANLPDSIYVWNGLTIFNNADSAGSVNVSDPNYSTPLPALDALGGH